MNSNDILAIQQKVEKFVEKYPVVDGPLTKISKQLNLEKGYLALLIAAIPVLLIFVMGGGVIIIDLVAYLYPVYMSIKAIESTDKEDDTLWLTYWIVFCFFKILESGFDYLVSFIPFYFIGKLAFLVWCYHPTSKGSTIIYNSFVKPYIVPALGVDNKKTD